MTTMAPLMAVCDALVVSALTTLGKRLLRMKRSHYLELEFSGHRVHEAHLVWEADGSATAKSLESAWDDLPRLCALHGPAGVDVDRLRLSLTKYVGHLVSGQIEHEFFTMIEFLETEDWYVA